MNNKRFATYLMFFTSVFFFSCRGRVQEGDINHAPANPISLHEGHDKYVVIDTKKSVVTWKGSMLIGPNSHAGYVYLSKGELLMEDGQLTGGTVEVDMNTIEDDNHKSDNNLIKHLKDSDFFDVKKYPFASIAITRVASLNEVDKEIAGNLTIKGISNEVRFPAKLQLVDGVVKADGRLVIDRTKWDVRYKSGKFYDLLADQTMSDSIEFTIKIVTNNHPGG